MELESPNEIYTLEQLKKDRAKLVEVGRIFRTFHENTLNYTVIHPSVVFFQKNLPYTCLFGIFLDKRGRKMERNRKFRSFLLKRSRAEGFTTRYGKPIFLEKNYTLRLFLGKRSPLRDQEAFKP